MFEKLKKLCDSFLEMGVPGFDVAIFKDGECILRHFNGYSDKENKIPVKGDERYYIYSCSKPITCTAALQLWEKGLFSLEDKLSDYMPEFKEMYIKTESGLKKAKNQILIRHLFQMTAGFNYDLQSPQLMRARKETNGKCPTREVMKYLAKEPLGFEPGERWEYSLCHDVLAAFVEVVSGERFEDYVKKNIFEPLGMKNSSFLISESEKETLAPLYCFNAETGKADNFNKKNVYILGSEYASGGAGCVSTVDDYIKFEEALCKGDIILKKETVELMYTDYLDEDRLYDNWCENGYSYGLGIRAPKKCGDKTDFGWGGAAGAYLSIDVKNGISLFFAEHLLSAPNQELRGRLIDFLMSEIYGKISYEDVIKTLRDPGVYNLTY